MATSARRISIVGNAGAGKTTLARELARSRSLEHLELDSLAHQANWTMLAPEQFRARVETFVAQPRWVVDGNYTSVGVLDIVWSSADLIVWLDLPRVVTTLRVARRSFTRVLRDEELWNGNRERVSEVLSLDPRRNIVMWSWTNTAHVREKYTRRARDPRWRHLEIVRLRSPAQVRAWLAAPK